MNVPTTFTVTLCNDEAKKFVIEKRQRMVLVKTPTGTMLKSVTKGECSSNKNLNFFQKLIDRIQQKYCWGNYSLKKIAKYMLANKDSSNDIGLAMVKLQNQINKINHSILARIFPFLKINICLISGQEQKLLIEAINSKNLKIVKLLIESQGIDLNQADTHGITPLCAAIIKGSSEIVKLLIEKGVDVNQANTDGITPLHLAITKNSIEMVKLFIEQHAYIRKFDLNAAMLLYLAIQKDNIEMVKLLIERAVDISKFDDTSITLIHHAKNNSSTKIQKLISENMSR